MAANAALQKAQQALAVCEQQNQQSSQQVVVAVPDAVLASASIPFMFPPVKLGHDNYVDGGIRQAVPIVGAIGASASNVWAVVANHVSVSPLPTKDPLTGASITSYNKADFLQIAARAAEDIMPTQVEQANIDPLVAWGSATVTIVQPENGTVPPDIHNGFTVDPGLIRIRMAHGYMRTDDVNTARELRGNGWAAVADQISQLLYTTDIVNLRYQIWLLEHDFHNWNLIMTPLGTVLPPNQRAESGPLGAILADIRQMKQQLQQLVQLRLMGANQDGSLIMLDRPIQGAVPDQPVPLADWWLKWEAHQFPTPGEPWDSTTPFSPLPLPVIEPQISRSTTNTMSTSGVLIQLKTIEISEYTPGARVFYTLDGTDPTTSSSLYTQVLTDNGVVTVKARAFTADGKSSLIATSVAPVSH